MLKRFLELLAQFAPKLMNLNTVTPNDLLYAAAIAHLGRDASPDDEAHDAFGCVDSVEEIHYSAFQTYIGPKKTLSTYWLYKHLKDSPRFTSTDTPIPGSIVISPTGYGGKNGVTNGHVGICGYNDLIMSNDSRTGLWDENYTVASWRRYYETKGGYPVRFFNRV